MEHQFDSLATYINLAKKTISKFSGKFYSSLRNEMLSNEDAISDVAAAIMQADWKWDKDRVGKTGLQKTRYAYRNQCAIWAIQTYITKKYKSKKSYSLDSINTIDKDTSSYSFLSGSERDPLDIIIENEERENLTNCIQDLLEFTAITPKQKEQLKMYFFDGMTLNAIGEKYGVTREAVRQSIKKAITIFQKSMVAS